MRGNFETCLTLLWDSDPPCLGANKGKTRFGLTRKTVASWRGAMATKTELDELEKGEASDILYAWFWRGVRADDLPKGIDFAMFAHAVQAGPKQAILDLQHVLNLVRPQGEIDGRTLRTLERATPASVIAGLASFPPRSGPGAASGSAGNRHG